MQTRTAAVDKCEWDLRRGAFNRKIVCMNCYSLVPETRRGGHSIIPPQDLDDVVSEHRVYHALTGALANIREPCTIQDKGSFATVKASMKTLWLSIWSAINVDIPATSQV